MNMAGMNIADMGSAVTKCRGRDFYPFSPVNL